MAVRFASGERVLHHESKILRQPLTNRLVHWGVALSILVLILTGLFKVADKLPAFSFSWGLTFVMTQLHNLSTVLLLLGIVGHLVAFIFPANRKLLTAMFHGKVELTYVEQRHCLWYDRLAAVHKHGLPDHTKSAEHRHVPQAESGAPDVEPEQAAQAETSTMEAASTTEAETS